MGILKSIRSLFKKRPVILVRWIHTGKSTISYIDLPIGEVPKDREILLREGFIETKELVIKK